MAIINILFKNLPKIGNLAQIRPETKAPDLTVITSLGIITVKVSHLPSLDIVYILYYYVPSLYSALLCSRNLCISFGKITSLQLSKMTADGGLENKLFKSIDEG